MSASVRVYAPASVGNVAAGFDVLGAALAPLDGALWGDVVEVAAAPDGKDSFEAHGPHAARLPAEARDNLVLHARRLFAESAGGLPPVAIRLDKQLPLASGLGSSSSSVVATLVALNTWRGRPLSDEELLALAGAAESVYSGAAHLDNVAPALYGGLQMVTAIGESRRLPFPDDLYFAVVHPDLELPTSVARAALPKEIPLLTGVEYGQNLASLVHALHTGDRTLIRQSLRDPLVEPHRAHLVKGFKRISRAAWEAGAWGCSFSGAGPALFAIAEGVDHAEAVLHAVCGAFAAEGFKSGGRVCRLDPQGARVV